MKATLLGLFILTAAPLAFCAPSPDSNVIVKPLPLTINSESTELAAGFAQVFTKLRHVPFHVQLQRDGEIFFIFDVKSVTASGAALLVETGKGLFYLVSPKDVIWISDAPIMADPIASPGSASK